MIGGLEEVARLCCLEFQRMGHDVIVLTDTDIGGKPELPFRVLRKASFMAQLSEVRSCDVFLEFNISLKGLIFPFLVRKPAVVSHQTWFSDITQKPTFRARLKRLASRLVTNITCSRAVQRYINLPASVIPNAYNEQLFRILPEVERNRDVIFVGRLVSDKGCNVLVSALAELAKKDLRPTLTITGSGPEEEPLKQQIENAGMAGQVRFTGPLRGEDLVREMNRHRIMVVPSLWAEPFGIVALEGIACGCRLIGSSSGGLGEAIGNCGMTFPNGKAEALASLLREALADRGVKADTQEHLDRHTSRSVAIEYMRVLEHASKSNDRAA
jgi:glycosyltransferase involved in cell wall biosynthesis